MSVHSICPVRDQASTYFRHVNFCLIVVGRFRSRVFFSCAQLSWDVVGSFLGYFTRKKTPAITMG
jgi:hypothetical protein